MSIRNAAKAVILNGDGDKILLNKNQNSIGDDMCWGLRRGDIYYDLPGGGQNQYETLEEAVRRECLEETGYTVTVGRLLGLYEEISMNEDFRAQYERYAHIIFFVFLCRLTDAPRLPPSEEDFDLIGSEWVSLADLKNIPLHPARIKENIERMLHSDSVLYLGNERG